jgi:toxin ParE1/3/4
MNRYILSPLAEADLDSIWDYTEETWGIDQAERYVRDIQRTCEGLASGHKRGRSAETIRPGYWKVAAGEHLIFYKTMPDGVLDIIRILHQSMDIAAQLEQ